MAFRKRVNIGRGWHFNLSGKGIGLGYQVFPGLSFSMNRKGLFCNTSIPGTGLYSRNKIGNVQQPQPVKPKHEDPYKTFNMEVNANYDGTYDHKLTYGNGKEITNPYTIQRILNSDGYKELVVSAINNCTLDLTELHRSVAKPISIAKWKKILKEADPENITPLPFEVEKPTYDSVSDLLYTESLWRVWTFRFWNIKKKRQQYVADHLEDRYHDAVSLWESAKEEYDKEQEPIVNEKKAMQQKVYDGLLKEYENFTIGDDNYIFNAIDGLSERIHLPFNIPVKYGLSNEYGFLRMSMELPAIDEFPQKKAALLMSGEISIKDKGKAESQSDYVTICCGLAFFFAGNLFNISYRIKAVEISAYIQGFSKATGNEEKQYVYSVVFTRDAFSKINCKNIDPIESLKSFPNHSKILKTFEMRKITPFDNMEIIKIMSSTNSSTSEEGSKE